MKNSIKVLQINVCLNVLSTGRICEQIGERILAKKWESYVATYAPIKPSFSKTIIAEGAVDRFLHRICNRFFDLQGRMSYFQTRRLVKKIEKVNPDIIHLHNIHDCWLNFSLLFKYIKKYNKPVVWTFHDCWAFTGHCAYFDDVNCLKWKTGCFKCPLKNKFSIDLSKSNYNLKKSHFASIDKMVIVPVSEWLSEITKDSFLGKYPIHTIHNGIDTIAFSPRQSELRQTLQIKGKFVLLGVAGTWERSKGFYDFIELSKNVNYQVVMIGVPESMMSQLPSNIISLNRTDSQEQLAEYYSMADVFVNPTYHDNFPTVNLEALSCGTPVVGYYTGGSPECIENIGTNGRYIDTICGDMVEPGNIKLLVSAIEKIRLMSENERTIQREACRQRALSYFDKNVCYNEYITLYEQILNIK